MATKDKRLNIRVSKEADWAIEEAYVRHGFSSKSEYIMHAIDLYEQLNPGRGGKRYSSLNFSDKMKALSHNQLRSQKWADKFSVPLHQFYEDALVYYLNALEMSGGALNQDPAVMIALLQSITDQIERLSINQELLSSTVKNGFGSLLAFHKGATYLLKDKDGELYRKGR